MLFHSAVTCLETTVADAAYYTTPSGAGGFAYGTRSGSAGWSTNGPHPEDERIVDAITTITTTLLKTFAAGPSGQADPLGQPDRQDHPATIRDITR